LLARHRTGRGQAIDMAQTDAATALVSLPIARYLRDGEKRRPGRRGVEYLRCKDGKFLSTAAWAQERWWQAFCDAIERPQYKNAPRRYQYLESQDAAKDIHDLIATKTRDEWLAIIPKNITVVPLMDIDELADGEFAKERSLIWDLDHPKAGKVRQYGSPLHFSDTPVGFRNFAPLLGEHTAEVLGELGYSASDIAALEEKNVVRTSDSIRRTQSQLEKNE
jgi:crotonobetainyl-CoA:carnitine CoA-transferase CaiB-like acyl-CoA transferase